VPLLEILIAQSTKPDELVCDPFMGSGSCGVAAEVLGRNFFGNDVLEVAFNTAKGRLCPDEP
jgi:DNA modification methylase